MTPQINLMMGGGFRKQISGDLHVLLGTIINSINDYTY